MLILIEGTNLCGEKEGEQQTSLRKGVTVRRKEAKLDNEEPKVNEPAAEKNWQFQGEKHLASYPSSNHCGQSLRLLCEKTAG